jgi:tetrahydromethanopterin S-methyltransferase subunit G
MSDDPENLILVYLRRIDTRVDNLRLDMAEVKQRLTALEIQVGNLAGNEASHYGQIMQRLDRQEARLERIERRLDLTEDAR